LIVEALLLVLIEGVNALVFLLPQITLGFQQTVDDFAVTLGEQVGSLDSFLPISEALPIVGWALTVYVPFLLVYMPIRWIYSMIPVFGR